jgi:hypothetical protein
LSGNETTTEAVDIPGELRLSNPVPPPITVRLPLVTWPHEFKNVLLGLLALLGGMLFLPIAAMTALHVHDIHPSLIGDFAFVILLVTFPFSLFFGIGLTGAALTCFWDAVRNDPVLEITADGLRDRRLGLSVPWSSIKCARFFGGYSIDLELRGPVTNWQNPFRVGVLFHRYRPKPNHVIVSVGYLQAKTHVVAYTILTLIQLNGGEVLSNSPGGLEMYPRLIPRRP